VSLCATCSSIKLTHVLNLKTTIKSHDVEDLSSCLQALAWQTCACCAGDQAAPFCKGLRRPLLVVTFTLGVTVCGQVFRHHAP
jgi:hypothetical protein